LLEVQSCNRYRALRSDWPTQCGREAGITKRRKPLIAIVEDNESVCRELEKLVRSEGMEAGTFISGEEFIDLVERAPWLHVDCVVLDVHMPKINGLEVQERLSQLGKTMPVVFMTADDRPGVREKALGAGAVAFLHKPFDPELFIKTLNEAVRRSALQNAAR
jgi:FixJ family two-component response regulator